MEMPFGKHKGTELEDIPLDYLEWLVDNVDLHGELDIGVKEAIEEHYYRIDNS